MLCISAAYTVVRCPSLRPFVCLSRLCHLSKRINKKINIIFNFFSPPGSRIILVFRYHTLWQYSLESIFFGINFQIHSVSLTILVSIHLLIHFSTHLCHHPHSRRPSLLHSFTPGSKPTFSTNPFPRRFLLPTGLPHDNGTGPDLSCSSFYF